MEAGYEREDPGWLEWRSVVTGEDVAWFWAMVAQAACCAEIPPFQEGHPYCPWCGSRRAIQ